MISVFSRHLPIKKSNSGMILLNIGSGARFHSEWTNIDLVSTNPAVTAHDIRKGLLYPDNTFDIVYHSHILEHLDREEAFLFLKECHRVIKPGGVIRIAVPDLEQIARNYLFSLEKALQGDEIWEANYDWMMLELYDQTVRRKSGGAMAKYLSQPTLVNEEFVISRIGSIAKQHRQKANEKAKKRNISLRTIFTILKKGFYLARVKISSLVIFLLLGRKGTRALSEGLFRQSGEIHLWSYDKFSIRRLLLQIGYENVNFFSATESNISGWKKFRLDSDSDGTPYKPDSLFIEAIKDNVK